MKTNAKISYWTLVEILGEENESAIEYLFCEHDWDDMVAISEFLPKWTELVIQGVLMEAELKK